MSMTERIPLTFPIEHDGLQIREIALRRPTVGDQMQTIRAAIGL